LRRAGLLPKYRFHFVTLLEASMRFLLVIVLVVGLVSQSSAQEEKVNDNNASSGFGVRRGATRSLRNLLAQEIRPEDFLKGKEKFKDAIDVLSAKFLKKAPIFVDEAAFEKIGSKEGAVFDQEVYIQPVNGEIRVIDALNMILSQIRTSGSNGQALIRQGRIHVVPTEFAKGEHLLKLTVALEAQEEKLIDILDELSDQTGASLILDTRAKQKGQTQLSLRLNGDVTLREAVRMVAEMADLKPVFMSTGVFITTPEHARIMEAELRITQSPPQKKKAKTK
jgi:hypothetical protein